MSPYRDKSVLLETKHAVIYMLDWLNAFRNEHYLDRFPSISDSVSKNPDQLGTFPKLFRVISADLVAEKLLAASAPRAHLPNSSIGSFSLQQPWYQAATLKKLVCLSHFLSSIFF